ncbi:transglycosylase domain-containing protein [Virgibacillus kimchii]
MNKYFNIPKKMKWALFTTGLILLLGLIGFSFILFGGRLVVDEENLVLDAATTIETREGEVVGKLYNENRLILPIDQIPEHVQQAFISIEDRRFYDHAGVDFRSVVRALARDLIAMEKLEGASTITQQVAKNLFLTNEKSWMRKTKEVMASIYLEQQYSKDHILELYLNEIYFGNGLYGVEAASNYFFSKTAGDLTVAEGAMLAGLAKAPNGYSPIEYPEKALERRNIVLHSMEDTGLLSMEQKMKEQNKPLGLNVEDQQASPWMDSYIDLVMKEAREVHDLSAEEIRRGGYRIIVNVDETAQKAAYGQFQKDDYFPGNRDGVEGAFVMMEQETGRIVSAIGGREYQLGDLNRVTVNRQPGSTIKPIAVYGPAMMQNEQFTPYTLIPDQLTEYDGYSASNVTNTYDGAVTLYDAIVYSKNAPSVWLLDQIGIPYAKNYLQKMDIMLEDDGLAIALGGLSEGITPKQLMESYAGFSKYGEVIDSYTIERIYSKDQELLFQANPKTKEVFTPQVAWNMTEILMETVEKGTASAGTYEKALAGKTGSTQHPFVEGKTNDAWFAGYTPEYVTASWIGYDRLDEDHYLTGGSEYATKLTKAILTEVDKQQPLADSFVRPENVRALPKPIQLPEVTEIEATYAFGSLSLVQGILKWQGSDDDRVVYRIYEERDGIDKRVGEIEGETEYTIDRALFNSGSYYVVPFNPLTKEEGKRSPAVSFAW